MGKYFNFKLALQNFKNRLILLDYERLDNIYRLKVFLFIYFFHKLKSSYFLFLSIKVGVKEEKVADYFLYVKFKKETMCLYDTELDPYDSTIFELRIYISNLLGLPLSIFRLKSAANVELFDDKTFKYYDLHLKSTIILETWQGWDNFLHNTIKGFTKQVLKSMSQDEYIKQYQMRVALYIAAYYGNLIFCYI